MAQRIALVIALLVLPAPSWAQPQAIRDSLIASRALYPTPMAPTQVSEMLSRAIVNHPGWALLRKDGGTACPTPYAGIAVSCDWIIDVVSGWGYDVLYDQEGAGRLVWSDGVPNGAGITTVPAWPVGAPQQPQDPQTPTTPGTPVYGPREQMLEDRIVARVHNGFLEVQATLERMFGCRDGKTPQGENCATAQDNSDAIRGVAIKLKEHDEKTNVIIAALKNAKTYLVAGSGLLGWLLPKLLASQPAAQPQGAQ